MDITLYNKLGDELKEKFFAFCAEYLPGSEPEKMKHYEKMFPEAFLAVIENDEIIGAVFGWSREIEFSKDKSFALDGIAVRYDCQKKGIGSRLIGCFEKAALLYGAKSVSVGSAGGYVEKFYTDRGYIPQCYKLWVDDKPVIAKEFSDIADYYSYVRADDGGFVVMEKRI